MRKIISNTTPIISLLKLGKLDLLQKIYKEVTIPLAVYNEIEAGKEKVYYQDLSKLEWVKIEGINDQNSLKYFLDLDAGEAEAIVLATETNADLILLDERLGRHHAKYAGLKVTGTIGILAKAKTLGLIQSLKPELLELKNKGIWFSDKLINQVLTQVGEI